MRRLPPTVAAAVILLAPLFTPAPASAGVTEQLKSAQRKANQAAAALAQAQTDLAKVEAESEEIEARAEQARQQLSGLEAAVRESAVRQYVEGGIDTTWMMGTDINESVRAAEMARYATVGAVDALDRYRAVRDDLSAASAELDKKAEQRRGVLDTLRKRRASVMAELKRLEAKQKELEAAAAKRSSRSSPSRSRGTVGAGTVIASGSWVCPVQGPRAFSNDWGQPRSGGRRHQGTDMMAPRGTPVVASVSGTYRPHNSRLGGISYYLSGDDGNTYFGTHLDSVGPGGRVSAGGVVGRVGNTGNARGGSPHLHFEIHPGGGGAVNPYPTLAKYC